MWCYFNYKNSNVMTVDFKEMNRRFELYGPKMEGPDYQPAPYGSATKAQLKYFIIQKDKELGKLHWQMNDIKKMFELYHQNSEFEIAELNRTINKLKGNKYA